MAILINNAILHILNNDGNGSVFSEEELDINSEICETFLTKHIKRLFSDKRGKDAYFLPESKALAIVEQFINGEIFFKEFAHKICAGLDEILKENANIPQGDIIIAQFTDKKEDYIAIIKLNCKECYTHKIILGEDKTDNQIVIYNGVLPLDGGKVDEACIIKYNPNSIKLIEKAHSLKDGHDYYFSRLFLECETEISKKEAVEAINEATQMVTEKFFDGSPFFEAKIKGALVEEVDNDGFIDVDNVAANIFTDNQEAKKEFIQQVRELGIKSEVQLGTGFTKQQFGNQTFKAENGIEIKFPTSLVDDNEIFEITENPDNSITLLIKNLRKKA